MEQFRAILWIVAGVGLVVFFALYFVNAGYGKFRTSNWGPTIPSRWGWMLMECPVFLIMLALWWTSQVRWV